MGMLDQARKDLKTGEAQNTFNKVAEAQSDVGASFGVSEDRPSAMLMFEISVDGPTIGALF